MYRSGPNVISACENSGPETRSVAIARSWRIQSSAAVCGSCSALTSTRCNGQSSVSSAEAQRGPSGVSAKRSAKVSASATVRRSAASNRSVSTGPWISTYSPVLYAAACTASRSANHRPSWAPDSCRRSCSWTDMAPTLNGERYSHESVDGPGFRVVDGRIRRMWMPRPPSNRRARRRRRGNATGKAGIRKARGRKRRENCLGRRRSSPAASLCTTRSRTVKGVLGRLNGARKIQG